MKEEPKVPYELRQRSKHYVGLWQGKHCICSICTNTERGKLDAQFLLEACDGREALLEQRNALLKVCKRYKERMDGGGLVDKNCDGLYNCLKVAIVGSK